MAVEILILSGSRQGQRMELDGPEFQVGDSSDCEVVFDAQTDPGARNRRMLFRLEEDGWRLKSLGAGQPWLNQQPVTGPMPIRSTDVVRLSESGPDFSFTIMSRRAKPSAAAPTQPVSAGPVALPSNSVQRAIPPVVPAVQYRAVWPLKTWAALGCGCLILLAVIAVTLRPDRRNDAPDAVPSLSPGDRLTPAATGDGGQRSGTSAEAVSQSGAASADQAAGPDTSAPTSSAGVDIGLWTDMREKNHGAVLGLGAEAPKGLGTWSLGTGCAIRHDTILTTASVATQLAMFREQGWKIWALSPEFQIREEIKDVQVHVGYLKSEANKKIFFDLALLSVVNKLPSVSEVATPAELAAIDKQSPVGCLGIAQSDPEVDKVPEPLGRFDRLIPEISTATVQEVTRLSADPAAARILFLPQKIPGTIWGSPVFNEQGKIIGVFTQVVQKSPAGNVNLNMATLVDVVVDWREGRDRDLWVPPLAAQRDTEESRQK